jgi:hypothetical protein
MRIGPNGPSGHSNHNSRNGFSAGVTVLGPRRVSGGLSVHVSGGSTAGLSDGENLRFSPVPNNGSAGH